MDVCAMTDLRKVNDGSLGRPVKAVIFDAYDTLVRIGEKLCPYHLLLASAARAGRMPRPDDAKALLTTDRSLSEAIEGLGAALASTEIDRIERALQAELLTIRPVPGVWSVLERLRAEGYAIGVCSNLATPYAAPVQILLPGLVDRAIWSFKAGCMKPEPAIYQMACSALGVTSQQALFVGTRWVFDVLGPREAGMLALQLVPDGNSP
jgi:FMN phosphatase YigB (HAD superfamily)